MGIMFVRYEKLLVSVVEGRIFLKEKTLGLVNDHEKKKKRFLSFICTKYGEEI